MTPVVRLMRRMHRHDHDALVSWTSRRRPRTAVVMRTITHAGDAAVVIAVTLAMIAFGGDALREAGIVAGFTLALSHALVQLLKRGVGRPRPALPEGAAMIAAPDRFSFPSGHAAAALSLALPLAATLATPIAAAILALGIVVGLSRCYLGVHYPGDVLAGWSLALGAYLLSPAALSVL